MTHAQIPPTGAETSYDALPGAADEASAIVWHGLDDLRPLLVPLTLLDPLPDNPNLGDVEAVKRSYETFGQRKPVVVTRRPDGRGTVSAGNTQRLAALAAGWTHLAVAWTDDDPLTEAAWAIADNRTAELGDTDTAALLRTLNRVRESDAVLFDATAYTEAETARLGRIVSFVAKDKGGSAGKRPERMVSEPGTTWLLGTLTLTLPDDVADDDLAFADVLCRTYQRHTSRRPVRGGAPVDFGT